MARRGRPRKVDTSAQLGLDVGEAPAPRTAPTDTRLDSAAEITLTTAALAELLGVSSHAIRKMTAGGMPKHARDCYRLKDVIGWWLERRDRTATAGAETAREELYREQTQKYRLENALRTSEQIESVDHEAVLLAFASRTRDALLEAPTKLAPRDAVKRAQLEDLRDAALEYVGQRLEGLANRKIGVTADVPGDTPTQRRRVGRPGAPVTR